ncbi:MAG: HAMP domain-containing sensor histidine kinase [Bellilinea sp.]
MMNENESPSIQQPGSTGSIDLSGSTIRSQLLWASLFPLAFFVLLTTLVTYSTLNQLMLNLVIQRNTAQVQIAAGSLVQNFASGRTPTASELNSQLQLLDPVSGSQLYVVDDQGKPVASSVTGLTGLPLNIFELQQIISSQEPVSQLAESTAARDKVVVSFAPIPGEKKGVIIIEPWAANISPAYYYQLILVGLLVLGTALSLGMLSLSIGRVIRPIAILAENATKAVPGSIFHPVPERGPKEVRKLINAFNQMVIHLAEQQSVLRQYAHKALLSQEEERQRLSLELHDGTLQDLVGLAQRVELCGNELDRDPQLARVRLDEIQKLLVRTIGDVRRISNALRPPVLEDFGLAVALDILCKDLEAEKPNLQCEYAVLGTAQRLQPDIELAVYRVVQEALANIRKHVKNATIVQVELMFGETEIQATVKNNGAVFANQDVRSFVRSGHLGLAGMYERARLFGGTLNLTTDPHQNTVVSLRLPIS